MKKTLLKVAITISLTLSTAANPWTNCGLGAMIFNNESMNMPILAIISNVTFDYGTTAVTSATITPGSCAGKNKEVAFLINKSYEELIEESALGYGNQFESMLNTLECEETKHSEVESAFRNELSKTVSSDTYSTQTRNEKVVDYYNLLINQTNSHCSTI